MPHIVLVAWDTSVNKSKKHCRMKLIVWWLLPFYLLPLPREVLGSNPSTTKCCLWPWKVISPSLTLIIVSLVILLSCYHSFGCLKNHASHWFLLIAWICTQSSLMQNNLKKFCPRIYLYMLPGVLLQLIWINISNNLYYESQGHMSLCL